MVGTFAATTRLWVGTAGRTAQPMLSVESCGGGRSERHAAHGGFQLESDHGERHGQLPRPDQPCHTRLTGRSPLLLPCAVTPRDDPTASERSRSPREGRASAVTFDPASPVFRAHEGGKLTVSSTIPLVDRESLSL